MNIGTIEFGGSEYPDGEELEFPKKLALMRDRRRLRRSGSASRTTGF